MMDQLRVSLWNRVFSLINENKGLGNPYDFDWEHLEKLIMTSPVLSGLFVRDGTEIVSRSIRYHNWVTGSDEDYIISLPITSSKFRKIHIGPGTISYRTAEQVVRSLEMVIPSVLEYESKLKSREHEAHKKKMLLSIMEATFDARAREAFKGTGLRYAYEVGATCVRLSVLLPQNNKAEFTLHNGSIPEELPAAVSASLELSSLIHNTGAVRIRSAGGINSQIWMQSE